MNFCVFYIVLNYDPNFLWNICDYDCFLHLFFVDLLVILLNKTQPSILIDKTFLCDFIHLSGNAFKSFLFTFVSADEFLRTQKCANSAVFTNFWLLTVCFHYDNAVKIELLSKFFYDLQKLVADWSNAFRHHDVAKPEKLLKKCREKRSHQQNFISANNFPFSKIKSE